MNLSYAAEAVADLERRYDFIAEKNPAAAVRVSLRLRQGIAKLTRQPRFGRPVRNGDGSPAPTEIRDWLVDRYVIRYLILDQSIVVLRIWHGREDREIGV